MSKLEELIARLCPDGVEYKELGDIGTLTRGKRFVHADAVKNGIPCIHYGELYTYYGISTESTKSFVRYELHDKLRYASKNDVIIVGAGENDIDIGIAVAYMGEKEVAVHDACYILKHNEDPKYLSYCLRTSFYHEQIKKYVSSGKICAISSKGLSKAKLPVPPLEVQREIVHILDSFTLLTAELAVELAARQKQYEFYRDMLLTFDDVRAGGTSSIPFCFLSDIADFRNGKGHEQNMVPDGKYIVVNSKFISTNGDVKKYSNDQICPLFKDDILMVMSDLPNGRALAKCYLTESDNKYTLNQRIGAIKTKDSKNVMTKYLFYILNRNKQLLKFDNGVDQTNLKKSDILHIKIPVPPLSEQQRIVDILDRFDALCNDITSGLPAEIEARKKQYEYYRDKLLTFKELKKEA